MSKEADLTEKAREKTVSSLDEPEMRPRAPLRVRLGTTMLQLLHPPEMEEKATEYTRMIIKISKTLNADLRTLTDDLKEEGIKMSKEDLIGQIFDFGVLFLLMRGDPLVDWKKFVARLTGGALKKKMPELKGYFPKEFIDSLEKNCHIILESISEIRKQGMVKIK